ncbi:MAG TPA: hypothetical protein ENK60_01995 [Anaerolineae bacterium]|nr:hypothetical protein [Anaerolineae bacterium]
MNHEEAKAKADAAARRIERAREEMEAAVARLYRNGQPIYSENEMSRRLRELAAPLEGAIEEAVTLAENLWQEAERIEAIEAWEDDTASLLGGMSIIDVDRLSPRLSLLTLEAESFPARDMPHRARAIMAAGDEVARRAYLAAVRKRLSDMDRNARGWQELQSAEAILSAPERERVKAAQEKAAAVREAAGHLSTAAGNARRDALGGSEKAYQVRL